MKIKGLTCSGCGKELDTKFLIKGQKVEAQTHVLTTKTIYTPKELWVTCKRLNQKGKPCHSSFPIQKKKN